MTKRSYRTKITQESDEDDDETCKRINDILEIKKLRKSDDLKLRSLLKSGKDGISESTGVAKLTKDEKSFGDGFAQETNFINEDADMTKFIEEEMAKRTGIIKTSDSSKKKTNYDIFEDVLQSIQEDLKPHVKKAKEDLVSNQMLCGIPEVDLGVEAKMRNIIATEDAKQKLMKDRWATKQNEAKLGMKFAPKNVSVNFAEQSKNRDVLVNNTNGNNNNNSVRINPEPSVDELKEEKQILGSEKSTDVLKLERLKHLCKK